MFDNDSSKADYQITWKNLDTKETGKSTFYTYGSDHLIAIAVLKVLHPSAEILKIDRLV